MKLAARKKVKKQRPKMKEKEILEKGTQKDKLFVKTQSVVSMECLIIWLIRLLEEFCHIVLIKLKKRIKNNKKWKKILYLKFLKC